MHIRREAVVIVIVSAFAFVGLVRARDEEKIPIEKVPAAVMKTVKEKFAKAEIVGVSKEVEDGKTTYEVELKLEGRNIDLSLKEDGTLLAVEREIEMKNLPLKVSEAVAAKYPKSTVKKAEEITSGTTVTYEVVLAGEGKKSKEIVFDPDGKILKEEEDED